MYIYLFLYSLFFKYFKINTIKYGSADEMTYLSPYHMSEEYQCQKEINEINQR